MIKTKLKEYGDILFYIRMLIVIVFLISIGFISIIYYQKSQYEQITQHILEYHYASQRNLESLVQEVAQIKNELILVSNNINTPTISDELNQSLYLIDRGARNIINIQDSHGKPEMEFLVLRMQEKLDHYLTKYDPIDLMQEADNQNLLAGIDTILLTLEQLNRLHKYNSINEIKQRNYDLKYNSIVIITLLFIALILIALVTRSSFASIRKILSDQEIASEKLNYQATHDALTGLVNRYEFERRAQRLITTTEPGISEHALCFMDLDQFKVINDTCGHLAGDRLLIELSGLLQDAVRQRDTLARLGGDEFGVLMEHCTLDNAYRVASTLQQVIQDFRFRWENQVYRIGSSFGLVAINDSVINITELMKRADASCYMAKDMGRNRIHIYRQDDKELARRENEMYGVGRINQALAEDRFCLYAQAILPLGQCSEKHYEILVRMKDESGKIIPPDSFLPAAERYNLITQIDRWVIKNTFKLLERFPFFLEQTKFISINLSGQSLTDENYREFVINLLEISNINGNQLCFEITETAAISNLIYAENFIFAMKEYGCRFALDDFGSGLSSFAYLKNMSVDYVKIDGMFVKDITVDPIDHAMVKSINEITQVMGMQTIAEFVENDEIKGMLKEIGVDYAQGYGISKPILLEKLLARSGNITVIDSAKRS